MGISVTLSGVIEKEMPILDEALGTCARRDLVGAPMPKAEPHLCWGVLSTMLELWPEPGIGVSTFTEAGLCGRAPR